MNESSATKSPPHVVIIGGGGTGGALAHDLTLRGVKVTLFERGELTSGTTGRHHGLLHSGARYAVKDAESAVECIEENTILRRIAPGSFELNAGLFVALTDEEVEYEKVFTPACEASGIPTNTTGMSKPRSILDVPWVIPQRPAEIASASSP